MPGGATTIVPETVPLETITEIEGEPATTAVLLVTVRTLLVGSAPVNTAVNPANGTTVNGPGAPDIVVTPVEPAAHGTTNGDEGVNSITATGGDGLLAGHPATTATWNDTRLYPFET